MSIDGCCYDITITTPLPVFLNPFNLLTVVVSLMVVMGAAIIRPPMAFPVRRTSFSVDGKLL